jgi:hypothetical protein
VFIIKTKLDRIVKQFKARLRGSGFTKVHRIDYNETFALTVCINTLRLFLATILA